MKKSWHLRLTWAVIATALSLCLVAPVAFAVEEGEEANSPEVSVVNTAFNEEASDNESTGEADDSDSGINAAVSENESDTTNCLAPETPVVEVESVEETATTDAPSTVAVEPEAATFATTSLVEPEADDLQLEEDAAGADGENSEGENPDTPVVEEPEKVSIATATASGYKAKYTYTGKAIKPKVTLKLGGKTLALGTDYSLAYASNNRAGKAKVTATGIGSYEGTLNVAFTIAKKSLKKLKIKACKRQVYTGSKIKPLPTIKFGKIILKKGVDYTVTYKNNKKLGTATMIVKGKGNYKGKVVKKFKIVPYMVVCMPERYPHRIKDVAEWLGRFGIKAVLVRNANANLSRYDGMVIPGGLDDVDPQFYGEKKNGADRMDPILDRLQMKLIKRFAKTGKPILGICRGAQITNVAFGGSLYQNIGRHKGYIKTKVKKNTWLASGVGKSTTVYHYHHQAVKVLAKNFKVSAWNYKGKRKIIEAFEHLKKPIFGVQYHPELSGSGGTSLGILFKETCAKYM